jgi:hypothetical protein
MVRRYVSLASVQRTIVESRPSGMDKLGEPLGLSPRAKAGQKRSPGGSEENSAPFDLGR